MYRRHTASGPVILVAAVSLGTQPAPFRGRSKGCAAERGRAIRDSTMKGVFSERNGRLPAICASFRTESSYRQRKVGNC
jgi:hypothetical protein